MSTARPSKPPSRARQSGEGVKQSLTTAGPRPRAATATVSKVERVRSVLGPAAKTMTVSVGRFSCTVCHEPMGICDCWQQCECGRTHQKGEGCPPKEAAQEAADFIALRVLNEMRSAYPEPMRHASGGFAKALKAHITAEAKAMVLEILMTDPREDPAGTPGSVLKGVHTADAPKAGAVGRVPKSGETPRPKKFLARGDV